MAHYPNARRPVQARVDEPFTVTGSLVDVRGRPLTGNQVTLAMGETEEATVTIGVDGSFTHEFTLPDSDKLRSRLPLRENTISSGLGIGQHPGQTHNRALI